MLLYDFITRLPVFHQPILAQEALDRKTLDIRRKAVRIEKYSDDKEYHIYIKDVKNLSK